MKRNYKSIISTNLKIIFFIKILIVTTLLLFMVCACTENLYSDVKYSEGEFYDREWERPIANDPNIKDRYTEKDKAISIACDELKRLQKKGKFKDYVLQEVYYDIEDEVYVMIFCHEYDPENVVFGSSYQIAVYKQTGEIIKTWSW